MLGRRRRPCPERGPRGRRGRETLHHLGQRRIGRRGDDLLLPQVEETSRKGGGIFGIVHGRDLDERREIGRRSLQRRVFGCSITPMTAEGKSADAQAQAAADETHDAKRVKVKKYANRRLYNTATSTYVTLDDLSTMVKQGIDFVVHDAKTGEDITRAVLTQIIVEEESKGGQNLLPIGFLRQLIGFYGDNLQAVVPRYLEASMTAFAHNQEQLRDSMQAAFGGFFPFGPQIEDASKRNLALFQTAMTQMWAPFGAGQDPATPAGQPAAASASTGSTGTASGTAGETTAGPTKAGEPTKPGAAPSLQDLQRQMEAIQRQLAALTRT
jgi:polyhydroxyalkanoate synthesis repressor PhaR